MRLAFLGVALIATVAAGGGCAITGAAPGGPLRPGATTQIQMSWALAYGPGSAKVGGAHVTANAESYGGTGMEANPFPMRIGLRQSLGSAVEASGDVGWLDYGAELRAGTPGGTGTYPLAVAAGVRRGGYSSNLGEKPLSGHLRLEIYPDISSARDGRFRLALSAGVGFGSFVHSLTLPASDRRMGNAPNTDPFGAIVARPETRLELGIGLHKMGARGAFEVMLLPWIVLDSGTPTKEICSACNTPVAPVTDYAQSWGLSLMIAPGAAFDLIGVLLGR